MKIDCESLPCPCLKPGAGGGGGGGGPTRAPKPKASCTRPSGVLRLVFSRSKYPNIRRHFIAAVKEGWPRVMVLNREGADERRDRLLEDVPTRSGFDRDEYSWRSESRTSFRRCEPSVSFRALESMRR